jgi:hypothetical protein
VVKAVEHEAGGLAAAKGLRRSGANGRYIAARAAASAAEDFGSPERRRRKRDKRRLSIRPGAPPDLKRREDPEEPEI